MAESIKVALELDDRGYVQKLNIAIDNTKKLGTEGQTAATKAASGFDRLTASADVAITKLKGLAVAFIGLQQIHSALQLADELSDLSKATDISIQKILGLQSALQAAGGNGEDAGRMISELMNTIDGAAQGSADAQDQLFRLGFTLKDMSNLTPEQALDKTIAALARMTDPIQRNALAFQLLGRAARNIDWDSVNQSLAENTAKYEQNAEAIKKAGEIFDRFEAQTKAMKVSLMSSLEPLSTMLDYFDKLAGGGKGSFALNAFKTIFETIAVLAVTIGQGIKNIVGDIDALLAAGGKVMKGDFSGAGDIMKKRSEELRQASIDLDQAVAKIMYRPERDNQRPTMANDPRLIGSANTQTGKPPVKLALQGEIDAINQIAEAYAKANLRAREKLQTDYDLAGSSDLLKKLTEETTRIQNAAADQIDKLQDKLKGLTDKQKRAGEAGAITKAIEAIKADAATSIKLTQDIIIANEERIRSIKDIQTAYELMNIAATAGTEQFIAGQQKLKDLEDARRQATLDPLAKQLDQIAVAEEKAAQARRSAIAAMPQFQAGEDGMNPEQAAAFARALNEVDLQRNRNIESQQRAIEATYEEQRSFAYGWEDAFRKYKDNAFNSADQARSYFETFTKSFEDAIVRFVQTGKLNFKDFANTIIAELVRIQAKKIAVGIFGEAGTGGGLLGGLFSGVTSFFGGLFKANGGPVTSNSPYIVGERGPELFIPRSTGTIIPNSQLAMGGAAQTVITYNIQAVDAASFRSLVARDPQFLFQVTEKGRRSQPTRSR